MPRPKLRDYGTYNPAPGRTLSTARTWDDRIRDLRHAACLSRPELAALTGLSLSLIKRVETEERRFPYRPLLHVILAIRKLEAIFKEELVRYLDKPHRLLYWRESTRWRLDTYGGYRSTARLSRHKPTVSFTGRTFEDIAQMDDVEAIRRLKVIKPYPARDFGELKPERRTAYARIAEAASRGDFMSLDAIARVVEDDSKLQPGRPVES